MLGRLVFLSGVLIGGGYAWHIHQRRKETERLRREFEQAERLRRMAECLVGVWSEPRPLIPDIETALAGPGEAAAVTSSGRLAELPLTPQAQRNAWSAVTFAAHEGRTQEPERTVRLILGESVAPGCDWSEGWLPYQEDPRFRDVYESVGKLLQLAELSLKYGPRSATDENPRGAMVAPGWVHERPAPTVDIRPGDYIEVMLDEYSADPREEGRHAEWAWVHVESAPTDNDSVAGTISLDAPPGSYPNILRYTERHGFSPGTKVVVPRRTIFNVIKGK